MRPIDGDELEKQFMLHCLGECEACEYYEYVDYKIGGCMCTLIKNAPTVKPEIKSVDRSKSKQMTIPHICMTCTHFRSYPDSYDCYNCYTDDKNIKPKRYFYNPEWKDEFVVSTPERFADKEKEGKLNDRD